MFRFHQIPYFKVIYSYSILNLIESILSSINLIKYITYKLISFIIITDYMNS